MGRGWQLEVGRGLGGGMGQGWWLEVDRVGPGGWWFDREVVWVMVGSWRWGGAGWEGTKSKFQGILCASKASLADWS